MTLEEKIAHLQATSMEQARLEGNVIIDTHQAALEKVFEDHKAEATRQSETRIKAEAANAKLSLNQALAKSQLEIKRRQSKIQQELKDKIFEEAYALVNDYMKTAEYDDFLLRCIHNAIVFANGEEMTIYLNPSDEEKAFFSGRCHRHPPDDQCGRLYRRYPCRHPQPQYSDRSFF